MTRSFMPLRNIPARPGPWNGSRLSAAAAAGSPAWPALLATRWGSRQRTRMGLYYDRDWRPLDKEQFAALQRDLVAAPRWIIDGNYASSLPIRLPPTR